MTQRNGACITAGAMAQNVCLIRAALGWAATVRAWIDHDQPHAAMALDADLEVLPALSVGDPAVAAITKADVTAPARARSPS